MSRIPHTPSAGRNKAMQIEIKKSKVGELVLTEPRNDYRAMAVYCNPKIIAEATGLGFP